MVAAGEVVRGMVKFFKEDKGWGAISSGELPDGQDAWVGGFKRS